MPLHSDLEVSEIRHQHLHDLVIGAVKITGSVVGGQAETGLDAFGRAKGKAGFDLIGPDDYVITPEPDPEYLNVLRTVVDPKRLYIK